MSDHVPDSSCESSHIHPFNPPLTEPVQTGQFQSADTPAKSQKRTENDDLIYDDPAPITEEYPAHSAPRRSVTWYLPAADGGS